jgi:hypothetical protein
LSPPKLRLRINSPSGRYLCHGGRFLLNALVPSPRNEEGLLFTGLEKLPQEQVVIKVSLLLLFCLFGQPASLLLSYHVWSSTRSS